MNASAAIADSLLGTHCSGIAMGPGLHAASGHADGRARHSVAHRTVHPLHWAEQRVPGTSPSLAALRRVPIALVLQWVQRDATAGYPVLFGMHWVERDEPP